MTGRRGGRGTGERRRGAGYGLALAAGLTGLGAWGGSAREACDIPPLPSFAQLSDHASLPDPFLSLDGTRITRRDQWPCRRAEISAQVQEYELGPKPDRPGIVTGAFAADTLTITAGEPGRAVTFPVRIALPPNGTPPYPAVIEMGGSSLDNTVFAELGVARITFRNSAMGAQAGGASRGTGTFFELYGRYHPASSMMAWAWGVSRIIDALETTPGAAIDPRRLAVTGCSRNGKGALVAGAFDERIALTIPQESGAGGVASWRISEAQTNAVLAVNPEAPVNDRVQRLFEAHGEQPWFRESFGQFGRAVDRLPFDHHMVMALVAPRALFVVDNTSMNWLGNESSFTSAVAAREVWTALGVPDAMGVSQVGGHGHCQFPASQRAEFVAFVSRFLLGDTAAATLVARTDGTFRVDRERWFPWTTPVLR